MADDKPRSTISTRIEHRSRSKAKGQRRHDMREGPQPKYVNASRTTENSVLVEPTKEAALDKLCEKRSSQLDRQRTRKSSNAIATCGIVTFSKQAQLIVNDLPRAEQDRLFLETAQRLAEKMGTTLHGAVVHRDESAIHMHYRLAAVRIDGRPISKVVDTRALQDEAAAVWSELGIERGTPKQVRKERGEPESSWTHRTVKELHEDLPAEIEAAQSRVEEAEKKAAEAEDRAEKTAKRLEKAQKKAEHAEGESERLAWRVKNYQKRLDHQQKQLDAVRQELEDAHAEIRRLGEDPTDLPKAEKVPTYVKSPDETWLGFIPKPPKYNEKQILVMQPESTKKAFGRLKRQKKQAEEESIYEKRRHEEEQRARRSLQKALIQPIVAPEPVEDAVAALWASEAEIVEMYRVQMQVADEIARVPPQNASDRQIAAALYRVGQDQGWQRMWFHVSDNIAHEIIAMAIEDDRLDQISFRTDSADNMLEEARAEDARLREQESAQTDETDLDFDPLGVPPRPSNGPNMG